MQQSVLREKILKHLCLEDEVESNSLVDTIASTNTGREAQISRFTIRSIIADLVREGIVERRPCRDKRKMCFSIREETRRKYCTAND